MNEQLPINRVEMELNQWRSREERFSKLFNFSLSNNRSLIKEKLHHYERIGTKYKGTKNIEERFALQMLKQEKNKILKQLYPNLLVRLVRKLFVAPLIDQIAVRKDVKEQEKNNQSLYDQVQRIGFKDLSSQIDQQIKQGHEQFTIPVSYYVNEKERLDHELSFIKNQSGQYQFEGYKTTLQNESKPDEVRSQYFKVQQGNFIDTTQAYNLLAGRSIQKEKSWIQLDLNDKDASGNHHIKEFHSGYGYDLEKALQQLPLKELSNKTQADKLKDNLKQGNRLPVTLIKNGDEHRFYIEANPQFKSVNIYDQHSRKITLSTALGNRTIETLKQIQKTSESKQENHSKKNNMRIS
ncbi:hypothetical protein SGQ83_04685 [Flavobacterium sp. Fl-318]|uniref:DUF3945 domain-containing protein n=1 Tax=Flavobacterium cupriresistens TaxID=2893885 RepID=A0ABU4R9W5_9FLAO|nr:MULTISPECIES: hypothetical protein [unclassified Flavobacterium]MDX6188638.1 hypothetical protein [Flavobacterium sp. Fl-318]UFH44696.1 hypothetical protein LNP23_10965 [Flavobacterium sp. F-323]